MPSNELYQRVFCAIEREINPKPGPVDPRIAKAAWSVFRVLEIERIKQEVASS